MRSGTISIHTDDFDYLLPEHLIAQAPLRKRDACRLLTLDRCTGAVTHGFFSGIKKLLLPGDRLVFNDTRVMPARVYGQKSTGVKIEFLFVERVDPQVWYALVKPARRLKIGTEILVDGSVRCRLRVDEITEDGSQRKISLVKNREAASIDEVLEKFGRMPLPPYIRREAHESDSSDYQTVYAREPGAVAAPTAGLHFTSELLSELREYGVGLSYVTLHVGVGTFRPVKVADPGDHPMHQEWYNLTDAAVNEINETRRCGGRIIAVGTTVVRVLEHCASADMTHTLRASSGKTGIMIMPPYDFRVVDGLITNFHLPRSTLLMLVSAFASREHVLKAYNEATLREYRFYSYGDAMFLMKAKDDEQKR